MTKRIADTEQAPVEEPVQQAETETPPAPEPLVSAEPRALPTPPEYATGAIKQDAETLAVAVRTNILDPDGLKDWGVMTVDRGGHYTSWEEVQNWSNR
jgi:hypothetical protein